jgi:nucleotide-binding universal stress UspA family protein
MGTHGRSGFSHLLMGSVAERVVRTAPCPVLTVGRHEREFIGPEAIAALVVA